MKRPARAIIELLFDLRAQRGATLVLVTHDLALAARCDRTIRLRSGTIEAAAGGARGRIKACKVACRVSRFLPPILRLALRDLRGGLAGLRILLACVALGVATIVGVNSLARSLDDGLSRDGRAILGGDASFSLIHRELSEPEERLFWPRAAALSTVATMRAMARADDGEAVLIEIKAVDDSWPTVGQGGVLAGDQPHDAFAMKGWRLRRGSRGRAAGPARSQDRRAFRARRPRASKFARRSSPSPIGSAPASDLGRAR